METDGKCRKFYNSCGDAVVCAKLLKTEESACCLCAVVYFMSRKYEFSVVLERNFLYFKLGRELESKRDFEDFSGRNKRFKEKD